MGQGLLKLPLTISSLILTLCAQGCGESGNVVNVSSSQISVLRSDTGSIINSNEINLGEIGDVVRTELPLHIRGESDASTQILKVSLTNNTGVALISHSCQSPVNKESGCHVSVSINPGSLPGGVSDSLKEDLEIAYQSSVGEAELRRISIIFKPKNIFIGFSGIDAQGVGRIAGLYSKGQPQVLTRGLIPSSYAPSEISEQVFLAESANNGVILFGDTTNKDMTVPPARELRAWSYPSPSIDPFFSIRVSLLSLFTPTPPSTQPQTAVMGIPLSQSDSLTTPTYSEQAWLLNQSEKLVTLPSTNLCSSYTQNSSLSYPCNNFNKGVAVLGDQSSQRKLFYQYYLSNGAGGTTTSFMKEAQTPQRNYQLPPSYRLFIKDASMSSFGGINVLYKLDSTIGDGGYPVWSIVSRAGSPAEFARDLSGATTGTCADGTTTTITLDYQGLIEDPSDIKSLMVFGIARFGCAGSSYRAGFIEGYLNGGKTITFGSIHPQSNDVKLHKVIKLNGYYYSIYSLLSPCKTAPAYSCRTYGNSRGIIENRKITVLDSKELENPLDLVLEIIPQILVIGDSIYAIGSYYDNSLGQPLNMPVLWVNGKSNSLPRGGLSSVRPATIIGITGSFL